MNATPLIGLLAPLALVAAPAAAAPATGEPAAVAPAPVDEFDDRYDAAKDDPDALWELYGWCEEQGLVKKEGKKVLKRILKLDPDHRRAREASGHVRHEGEWFDSQEDLDKHLAKEEERIAKERGWVKFEGRWVPPKDLPYLKRGLVRTEDGEWLTPEEIEKLEAGWVRQDLVWVSPGEANQIDAGLWKCDDEWLSLERADAWHSQPERWWQIPSGHFVLHTTLPRAKAMEALDQMESAFRDLVKLTGHVPTDPLHVALFNSLPQYNEFAGERDPLGFSGTFGAYPDVAWVQEFPRRYFGGGVGYWDVKGENGDAFGPFHARFAAAYSFVEHLDRPTELISDWEAGKSGSLDLEEVFEQREAIPDWFRFGVAACAGRYWTDIAPGADKEWVRRWSIENIAGRGGLDQPDTIIEFEVATDSQAAQSDAGKMINQAGLLMAYTIYGEDGEVREAHAAVKDALKRNDEKDLKKALKEFEKRLGKAEQELRAFARI